MQKVKILVLLGGLFVFAGQAFGSLTPEEAQLINQKQKPLTIEELKALMAAGMNPATRAQIGGNFLVNLIREGSVEYLKYFLKQKVMLRPLEKAYLLDLAKEESRKKRQSIGISKSKWDAASFVIGAALTFLGWKNDPIFGDPKALNSAQRAFSLLAVPGEAAPEAEKETYEAARKKKMILNSRALIDGTLSGSMRWLGYYLMARGWFCMSAHQQYVRAQHIVDIIERMPTTI